MDQMQPARGTGRGRPSGITIDVALMRSLRRKRGWTQEDLAVEAGVTSRTVAAAESGHRIALSTARHLARVLVVPLTTLSPDLEA
jgi:transcriptional regulator with XRE-family HTH domain